MKILGNIASHKDLKVPSELECKPFIVKALKEFENPNSLSKGKIYFGLEMISIFSNYILDIQIHFWNKFKTCQSIFKCSTFFV